jgi:hypothetical protein
MTNPANVLGGAAIVLSLTMLVVTFLLWAHGGNSAYGRWVDDCRQRGGTPVKTDQHALVCARLEVIEVGGGEK